MNERAKASRPWGNTLAKEWPWQSPATDPTNPDRDETVGHYLAATLANERRVAEPGLTDRDCELRL
jgi:hypothetical protein